MDRKSMDIRVFAHFLVDLPRSIYRHENIDHRRGNLHGKNHTDSQFLVVSKAKGMGGIKNE